MNYPGSEEAVSNGIVDSAAPLTPSVAQRLWRNAWWHGAGKFPTPTSRHGAATVAAPAPRGRGGGGGA